MNNYRFSSRSGYIVYDIFDELKAKVVKGDLNDSEAVCFWTVELICSGKCREMVSWMIALYAQNYNERDVDLLKAISHNLQITSELKYAWKNNDVRHSLLVAMLWMFMSKAGQNRINVAHDQFVIDTLPPVHDFTKLANVLGQEYCDHPCFGLLSHLWSKMADNDTHAALIITNCIVHHFKTQGKCVQKPLVNGLDNNIALVWKVLHNYANELGKDYREFARLNYELFLMDFSKKMMPERLDLLYKTVVVCAKKKELKRSTRRAVAINKNIDAIMSKVPTLYAQILGSCSTTVKVSSSKPNRKEQSTTNSAAAAPDNTSKSPNQKSKLDILFCYTFRQNEDSNTSTSKSSATYHGKPLQYKDIIISDNSDIQLHSTSTSLVVQKLQ